MPLSSLLDILFISFLIYVLLVSFKRTKAAFVLMGILIVAGLYLVAHQFNLVLTATVFQGFFAVIVIASVIIFQEEIRHFFEQVAWSLNQRLKRRPVLPLPREEVEILARTLTDLAKEKVGALVVLVGKDLIDRHLTGGVVLNGKLSESLLKSLFDPHSPGHDGAMIIEWGRVVRFASHLPLSKNLDKIGREGTRHAAALGLSEFSDALSLVVSEEKGTISAARHGEISGVRDFRQLLTLLEEFYGEVRPPEAGGDWKDFLRKNYREKVVALLLALTLWLVHVRGEETVYKTYMVPVEYAKVGTGLVVEKVEPEEVEVTFLGPRRAFYFLGRDKIKLLLKTWDLWKGEHVVRVSASDLTFPDNVTLENIDPRRVVVRLESAP